MEKIRLRESLKLIILISGDLGRLGEVTLNVGLKEPFCFTDEMKIQPIWDSEGAARLDVLLRSAFGIALMRR
jgi:hypothetical protein